MGDHSLENDHPLEQDWLDWAGMVALAEMVITGVDVAMSVGEAGSLSAEAVRGGLEEAIAHAPANIAADAALHVAEHATEHVNQGHGDATRSEHSSHANQG